MRRPAKFTYSILMALLISTLGSISFAARNCNSDLEGQSPAVLAAKLEADQATAERLIYSNVDKETGRPFTPFITGRTLIDCDLDYIKDLSKLKSSDHVIDLGAGDFEQVLQIATQKDPNSDLKILRRSLSSRPNVTGISLSTSPRGYQNISRIEMSGKGETFVGRKFEDIPDEEILAAFGQATVIDSRYGVFTYSTEVPTAITKVAKILKKGGRLYITKPLSSFVVDDNQYFLGDFLVYTGAFARIGYNVFVRTGSAVPDLSKYRLTRVLGSSSGGVITSYEYP